MLQQYDKEHLVTGLYDRGLLQFGDFTWTLKSGRRSPIYYNQRKITSINPTLEMSRAEQRMLINNAVYAYSHEVLKYKKEIDHIYGIPQAMTHLSGMVALRSCVSSVWGRIGKKQHGEHDALEGDYQPGDKVLQLDDVVTDAGSKIESAAKFNEVNLETAGFVVMLDREEGGAQAVNDAGYQITAITGLTEAVGILRQNNRIGDKEIGWVEKYHEDLRAHDINSTFMLK